MRLVGLVAPRLTENRVHEHAQELVVILGGEDSRELRPGRVRQRRDQRAQPKAGMPLNLGPRGTPAAALDEPVLLILTDDSAAAGADTVGVARPAFRPLDCLPGNLEPERAAGARDLEDPLITGVVQPANVRGVGILRRRAGRAFSNSGS